jgi:hypothetical protein
MERRRGEDGSAEEAVKIPDVEEVVVTQRVTHIVVTNKQLLVAILTMFAIMGGGLYAVMRQARTTALIAAINTCRLAVVEESLEPEKQREALRCWQKQRELMILQRDVYSDSGGDG